MRTTTTMTKTGPKKPQARQRSAQSKQRASKQRASKQSTAKQRASSVDPRIAARRVEVRRGEGRRRLRVLIALAVVTLIAVGAIAFLNSSMADVDEIEVTGAASADAEAIVAATGIIAGQPLIELDLDLAAANVRAEPWVLDATVSRSLDGTVSVTVTERTPILAAPHGGEFVLVDASGRQLDVVPNFPPGFMPIAGLELSGLLGQPATRDTQAVLRLLGALPADLSARVDQVFIDQGTLYLDLGQGGRVKLGDDTALSEKMISLETILSRVDLRCLWEIDVRVPSAPAVTRVDANGNPRATLTDLSQCS